jgi:hypothetical protein
LYVHAVAIACAGAISLRISAAGKTEAVTVHRRRHYRAGQAPAPRLITTGFHAALLHIWRQLYDFHASKIRHAFAKSKLIMPGTFVENKQFIDGYHFSPPPQNSTAHKKTAEQNFVRPLPEKAPPVN